MADSADPMILFFYRKQQAFCEETLDERIEALPLKCIYLKGS
jgi:hypothetical protein